MKTAKNNHTKQVGIRLGMDTFQHLELEARDLGISPTSRARQIISDHLGEADSVSGRAPRRTQNQPAVTPQMQTVIIALSNLMSVQMNLRNLSAYYKQNEAGSDASRQDRVLTKLAQVQSVLSDVKQAVLEAAK